MFNNPGKGGGNVLETEGRFVGDVELKKNTFKSEFNAVC
jgi:hypothetical protein